MSTTAPQNPMESRLSRARQLYDLGRYAEALPLIDSLCTERPLYADLWHMLGVSLHHAGQISRAEKCLRRALELNPQYTEASLSLTVLLNDTGRYEAAKTLYRQALSQRSQAQNALDPLASGKIANMHAELAGAYEEALQPEAAEAEYLRALALRPTFVDIRLKLVTLLLQHKRLDEALVELRRCVADRPTFLPAQARLGMCLMAAGQRDQARQVWQAMLVTQPDHADALRGLRLLDSQPTTS